MALPLNNTPAEVYWAEWLAAYQTTVYQNWFTILLFLHLSPKCMALFIKCTRFLLGLAAAVRAKLNKNHFCVF